MAYEAPVIRSVLGNAIEIMQSVIPSAPVTYLTAAVSATATALSVLDNNAFSQNDLLLIGRFGVDRTEIKKVNAAVTLGTALTTTAVTFDHPVDTEIRKMLWDQIEISGAATATGSKTVIATVDIQPDRVVTTYVNTGTTYAFYFARFKNSVTSTFSAYSGASQAAGYATTTLHSVKKSALDMVNEKINDLITDTFLNQEIFNCEQEVWSSRKVWSWAYTFNYVLGDTVEGGIRVALPSDISDPNSDKSILMVRIGSRSNLIYVDKATYDRRVVDVVHTTLAADVSLVDVTITLTDSSDFDDTGSIEIGADSAISYTANNRTTNVLSGVTGITATHATGDDVWQAVSYGEPTYFTVWSGYIYFDTPVSADFATKNIYLSYYRKPTAITQDTDTLNIPDFTLYHYYLAWKILLRKANGMTTQESEAMRLKFEERKLNLMRTERTGQRNLFKPRINTIRYTDSNTTFITTSSIP